MGAREETSSLVAMDDMLLGGFCGSLLKFLHSFASFGWLPFFDKRLPVTFEGFYMRLQARVAGGTAMVLTQIFDGGVFIWHRECQHTIQRRVPRQYRGTMKGGEPGVRAKGRSGTIDVAREVSLYLRHVSIVQRDRTRDS